jgi:membrane-associated phospholipid phosphatase
MEKNIPGRALVLILILLCTSPTGSLAQNADITMLRQVQVFRLHNRQYDGLMNGVTNSVYPIVLAAPIAQLAYEFTTHDTAEIVDGFKTVAALAINTIITSGLKYAVNRARPYKTYADIHPYSYDGDPSFPSGHTSYAFSLATIVSLEYKKWYIIVPAYAWAATVGYSRVYLGEHYPSDVLAGAVVGAGSAWLSYKGSEWLLHHRNKKIHSVHIGS